MKKQNQYHFINQKDLMEYFIHKNYNEHCIVILLDCKKAFATIPKLNILKRDNLSAYMLGLINDFCFIEFESKSDAEDWIYSLSNDVLFYMYLNGKLIRNDKGLIK